MDSAGRAANSPKGGLAFAFVLASGRWEAQLLSPALQALVGARTDAPGFVAAPLLDRIPPEERRSWGAGLGGARAGPAPRLVHRFLAVDGTPVRVQTEAVALSDPDGALRGVATSVPVGRARARR